MSNSNCKSNCTSREVSVYSTRQDSHATFSRHIGYPLSSCQALLLMPCGLPTLLTDATRALPLDYCQRTPRTSCSTPLELAPVRTISSQGTCLTVYSLIRGSLVRSFVIFFKSSPFGLIRGYHREQLEDCYAGHALHVEFIISAHHALQGYTTSTGASPSAG